MSEDVGEWVRAELDRLAALSVGRRALGCWDGDDFCRPVTRTGRPSTFRVRTVKPRECYL